ncbi:hypothetical protein N7532_011830 [Penicillium argentinense]|uniref:CCHC-type domain-containing protein n=1 Tax=Penicillium argentinense TaxID=1131581 RepID=A0A9W9JVM0_9EURO|nr:uncharacterized protein N7532_011830 [Penicillium argentinense]KAJ5082787.1 hypothetical protein N7532_011830 [Penicillium argentinense]
MPDSEDEADSRIASVGAQRARKSRSSSSARSSSNSDFRTVKKHRRNPSAADRAVVDFVPRGGTFSQKPLEIDPDDTSSSGSDSDNANANNSESSGGVAVTNPHAGNTAPAISWNQGRKNAVRTTLGKRKSGPHSQSQLQPSETAQFKAVNNQFWRSRSASASSGTNSEVQKDGAASEEDSVSEEGEVKSPQSDSDDSVSSDSEADDSILLNIGTSNDHPVDDYDPESLIVDHSQAANGHSNGFASDVDTMPIQGGSKEAAFQQFSRKYPTPPSSLGDLKDADLDRQMKSMYWYLNIQEVSSRPIRCLECFQQGHLAEVCPTKECEHCGAWDEHASASCPSWRRCLVCRERGHDGEDCSAPLKTSPDEAPCDLCGVAHLETQCSQRFRFPMREATNSSIKVAISCARCLSSHHLYGNCPSVTYFSFCASSFSLMGLDPAMITNTNHGVRPDPPRPNRLPQGPGRARNHRRGGGGGRRPSSDSSDDLPRAGKRPQPVNRGKPRGNIRFGHGAGLGSDQPRGAPPPNRGGGGNRGRGGRGGGVGGNSRGGGGSGNGGGRGFKRRGQ